jgi:hypothetical protein
MPLRSTIIGAASGVALLAGVFGFAVGLPEVVEDDTDARAATEEKQEAVNTTPVKELLPETILDGALLRFDQIDPQYKILAEEIEGYGGEKLSEAFDTDVAVAIYATPDVQAQVAVTIYDGESGLFLQAGPPLPPELSANQETVSDVIRVGDTVCIGQWQTQALAQGAPPFQTQCQRVVAGRTVNVYATPGLTVEQTAEIVDDVITGAGLD